ncbi:hypothetical protein [Methylobacterium sp. JK268]
MEQEGLMVRLVGFMMSTSFVTFASATLALACGSGPSTVIRNGKPYQVYLRCGPPHPPLPPEEKQVRAKQLKYPPAPKLSIMEDAGPRRHQHRSTE